MTSKLLLRDTDERQARPVPITWQSHVLVPLAQNVLGGVAVWGGALIGYMTIQYARGLAWDMDGSRVWCGLAGGLVACVATVIRFFGDDLGMLAQAYKAGQRSRDTEINNLHLELRALRDARIAAQAGGASAERREQEFYMRARTDAKKIIQVHFSGDSIARKAMETRGMGQKDWARAIRLLKASGVMNEDMVIEMRSAGLAVKQVEERIASDTAHGETFVPGWKN